MVEAVDAVSAILNHSKIGGKINPEALKSLLEAPGLGKRSDQTTMDSGLPQKFVKNDGVSTHSGGLSLLSGLTLKF